MKYGSVCSGKCAATQAWSQLGWEPAFFSEVDAFASGVLAYRFGAGAPETQLDPQTLPEKERKHWVANNRELDRMKQRGDFAGAGPRNLGDFTLIPWRGKPAEECPDGPRYKVIGNSMTVDVMYWLGLQLEAAIAAEAEERIEEAV